MAQVCSTFGRGGWCCAAQLGTSCICLLGGRRHLDSRVLCGCCIDASTKNCAREEREGGELEGVARRESLVGSKATESVTPDSVYTEDVWAVYFLPRSCCKYEHLRLLHFKYRSGANKHSQQFCTHYTKTVS